MSHQCEISHRLALLAVTKAIRPRVASNIRDLSRRRGVSLNKLADFAGVSRRQLYAFLGGEVDVTLGWLERIAEVLQVDVLDLATPDDDS